MFTSLEKGLCRLYLCLYLSMYISNINRKISGKNTSKYSVQKKFKDTIKGLLDNVDTFAWTAEQ